MVRRLALWALLSLAVVLGAGSAAAADRFHAGEAAAGPALPMPAPVAGMLRLAAGLQRGLNARIAQTLRQVGGGQAPGAWLAMIGLSFLFGVLHAVGPGHGKTVVAAYLLAERRRWQDGMVVGALISLLQGLSAILLVGVLGLALDLAHLDILNQSGRVQVVSYGLIAGLGAVMLVRAWRGQGCAHGHGIGHHHHDHHHEHHPGHHHGHHHGHRRSTGRLGTLALVAAAGLTPCASAIIVMLFALANGVFLVGSEAALAMSAGMALTVSAIGLMTIAARRLIERLAPEGPASARLERALGIGGALLVTGFAGLLFVGALAGL